MKSWAASKTVRVNMLTMLISIVGVVAASDLIQDYPQVVAVLTGIVVPMLNVFLRWVTDQPISSISPRLDAYRPGVMTRLKNKSIPPREAQ